MKSRLEDKPTMTAEQLNKFLEKHDMRDQDFVDMLGVTKPALDHWLRGRRAIPTTTVKILRLFDQHPQLMNDF